MLYRVIIKKETDKYYIGKSYDNKKYKILKNDKMVEGLSLNNKVNAIKIVDILNADNQIK